MLLLLLFSSPADACGPYFDHPRLSWVGREMLSAPVSSFDDDMRLLANATEVPWAAQRVRTSEGDALDLRAAGADEDLVEAWLEARRLEEPAPAGVPLEFQLYQQAVLDLRAYDLAAAEDGFEALLALPPEERVYRGVWAAYMLPMARPEDAPDAVRAADYARVREVEGVDTLGLRAASYRQEAVYAEPARALSACLEYRAAGGTRFCQDLHGWAENALAEDPHAAAQDPLAAQAISAYLTAHPDRADAWLDAADELAGADRLAWAAYQRADFDRAAAWADRSDAPMARWIEAKLAVREGDLQAATQAMTDATAGLKLEAPENTGCPHHGHDPLKAAQIELGILLVSTERYDGAILAFLDGEDWLDAAWVAERLLTTDELVVLVERHFPRTSRQHLSLEHAPVHDLLDGEDLPRTRAAASMRHLLARRLAREGRWSEAIPYFPYAQQYAARQVLWDLRRGDDLELSDTQRGESLYAAAYRLKQDGFELVATEMEPDFRVLRGWYSGPYSTELRAQVPPDEDPYWLTEDEILAMRQLVPTADEQARAAESGPSLDRRYHWVWDAFDLAERGTALLPDDHADLPMALCTAGKWQRYRDPAGGERLLRRLDTLEGDIDRSWWLPTDSLGPCQPPVQAAPPGCAHAPGAGWLLALLVMARRASSRSPDRPSGARSRARGTTPG